MSLHLPRQPNSFIGRADELAEIARLLADPACRLLTLVGSGGIGKTRLAIEAARHCTTFDDIHFIALQSLSSPNLMVSVIAEGIDLRLDPQSDPKQLLLNYLRDKSVLLLLDNFEHLLSGSSLLVEILDYAPHVKLLVTSRERLNLVEEWVLDIAGLNYPAKGDNLPTDAYGAVQLFVQRAQQIQAGFSLDEHSSVVKLICQQVEGMPLGLELAATWLRVMSPKQIALQIASNLDFLTTPLRNMPERHRSIRSVFEQSWNLLSPAEQDALMRLSVFRGGFDREAAQQVAGASLPLLAALADKSLIRLGTDDRYDLHELLRQYAADKLVSSGAASATLRRHFDYFLMLAEQMEKHAFGPEQVFWFDRVETELDNFRAAMNGALRDEEGEIGLRMVTALAWFFTERDHSHEGLEWFERLLSAAPDAPPVLRAKALQNAGAMAGYSGYEKRTEEYCQQALELARGMNDRWNEAWALSHYAFYMRADLDRTRWLPLLEESIRLFRDLHDDFGLSHNLIRRAFAALHMQNYAYARTLSEEAAVIARRAGDKIMMGWANNTLGMICTYPDGDFDKARTYLEAGLSYFREAHFWGGTTSVLVELAALELLRGNDARARMYYLDLLNGEWEMSWNIQVIIVGIAAIARTCGNPRMAITLLGAIGDNYALYNYENLHPGVATYASQLSALRAEVDPNTFAEAWAAGQAMTQKQAYKYAGDYIKSPMEQSPAAPESATAAELTKREVEIVSLMAEGLSNRDIAERLFLTSGTVKWYLSEIYSKLGVKGRVQAVARARELALLT